MPWRSEKLIDSLYRSTKPLACGKKDSICYREVENGKVKRFKESSASRAKNKVLYGTRCVPSPNYTVKTLDDLFPTNLYVGYCSTGSDNLGNSNEDFDRNWFPINEPLQKTIHFMNKHLGPLKQNSKVSYYSHTFMPYTHIEGEDGRKPTFASITSENINEVCEIVSWNVPSKSKEPYSITFKYAGEHVSGDFTLGKHTYTLPILFVIGENTISCRFAPPPILHKINTTKTLILGFQYIFNFNLDSLKVH